MIYSENYPSFGEDDKHALRSLIRSIIKPGFRILEIGSWLGSGSTRVIIEELTLVKDTKLYCVDTWKGSPNVPRHQEIVAKYDVLGTFFHNIKIAGGEKITLPLVMTSRHAAEIFTNYSLDMVFIDGDHSYLNSVEDIDLWRSKVRSNGIISGHDCECRPVGNLREKILFYRNSEHISGNGTHFSVIHPGVIIAVEEAFNGKANLWADAPFQKIDGSIGRATIWNTRL